MTYIFFLVFVVSHDCYDDVVDKKRQGQHSCQYWVTEGEVRNVDWAGGVEEINVDSPAGGLDEHEGEKIEDGKCAWN